MNKILANAVVAGLLLGMLVLLGAAGSWTVVALAIAFALITIPLMVWFLRLLGV